VADTALTAFVKSHEGCFFLADKPDVGNLSVIPFGNFAIDYLVTSIGGVPMGRIVEIFGPTSGGKSTLALHAVASAQALGFGVLYIDTEHALNLDYARQLGVDTDVLVISQPETGEDAIELAVEAAKDPEAIRLIVLDSVANLVPKAELEGEIGDKHVGLQARLMGQALRKLTAVLSANGVAMIFINQERSKIGVTGYGPMTTTTGGNALPYYASLRLDVTAVGQLKSGEERIGHKVKVVAAKNKLAPPFRSEEVELHYGFGYDNVITVMDLAEKHTELVTKSGNTWSYKKEKLGGSRAVAISHLREHPEIVTELEAELRKAFGFEEDAA